MKIEFSHVLHNIGVIESVIIYRVALALIYIFIAISGETHTHHQYLKL